MALKRIRSDIRDICISKQRDPHVLDGIDYFFSEDNMMLGYGLVRGSANTPYYQGFYLIKMEFPETYPYEPPKCTHIGFCNRRQSPNFHDNGTICVSRLNTWNHKDKDRWLPTMDICGVLIMIRSQVLTEDPLDNEPDYNYSTIDPVNSKKYDEIVRYCNYRYNVVEVYHRVKYHNLDMMPDDVADDIACLILDYVKAHREEYISNMELLITQHEGKFYNCITYPNSNIYCEYRSTLDTFNLYMGFVDKIKIKMKMKMKMEMKQ